MSTVATLCRAVLACCFFFASAGASAADDFPQRPIRIVLGFSAAGTTDALARMYASKLSEVLKVPVVVENRVGAGQLVAIRTVMAAPPDGYTLFLGTGSAMSQGPGVRKDLPYDPLKDFSLIAMFPKLQAVVVVNPSLPVRTMGELLQYAKAHPGKLNYGSSGIGAGSHLQMEYLMSMVGIRMTHIPYKADGEVMAGMGEGSVQIGIVPAPGATPLIKSGRIRALAVTGTKHQEPFPDVPTLGEVDPRLADMDLYSYNALVGPKGLAQPVVEKLNAAVNQVSAMPQMQALLREQMFELGTERTPEDLRKFIVHDTEKYRKLGEVIKLD